MPGLAGIAARNANNASGGNYRVMGYGPGVDQGNYGGNTGAWGNTLRPGQDVAVSPNLLGQYPHGSQVTIGGKVYTVNDTSWFSPGNPTSDTFEIFGGRDMGHTTVSRFNGDAREPVPQGPRGVGTSGDPSFLYDEPRPRGPRGVGANDTPEFVMDEPNPGGPQGVGANEGDPQFVEGNAPARGNPAVAGPSGALPEPRGQRPSFGSPPPPLGADYFANHAATGFAGLVPQAGMRSTLTASTGFGRQGTVNYAGTSATYGAPDAVDLGTVSPEAEAAGAAETARLRAGGIDPNSATGARIAQAGAGGPSSLTPGFIAGLGDAGSRAAAQGASQYQLGGAQFSSRAANALLMASQANGGEANNMRGTDDAGHDRFGPGEFKRVMDEEGNLIPTTERVGHNFHPGPSMAAEAKRLGHPNGLLKYPTG